MRILLLIAARNLIQGGRRTALVSVALMGVTSLLVLMLSLSQGVTETMLDAATTISAGHVNVSGFYKPSSTAAAPMITDAARIRRIAEENTRGVVRVVSRHRGWAKVVSETGSLFAGLTGVNIEEEDALVESLQLAKQSDYKEGGSDDVRGDLRGLAENNTALLFVEQAKRLEVDVGDNITIRTETMRGTSNTADVTVVAIAKDIGLLSAWSVFVPTGVILEAYSIQADTTGAVQLYLEDPSRSETVMAELREVYEEAGFELMDHQPDPFFMKFDAVAGQDWVGQKLDLTIWSDEVSFLKWALTAIDSISFLLIAILMGIIGVGIMNAMWIAVRERTREVGTLRALGMSRNRVLAMFLLEALLLGLFSTAAGAGLGAAIASGLDAAHIHIPVVAVQAILLSDVLHLSVQPGQLVAAIIAFSILTALSALWPAARAAGLRPVTAMHAAE